MNDTEAKRQKELNCFCLEHCAPKQRRIDDLSNLLAAKNRESSDWEAERDRYRAEAMELRVKVQLQDLQLSEVRNENNKLQDGWNQASEITKKYRLENSELCGVLHALHLFVDVYEGKVLDKKAAQELIRKYAKRSEAVGNAIIEIQESLKRKCALGPQHTEHDASCGGCNHDPEHNPVTGRTYCEKCGITL